MARAAVMDGGALGVHGYGHRHIPNLDLVDRLHSQILIGDGAGALDSLGHEIGGTAHGDQVDSAVILDGLDRRNVALDSVLADLEQKGRIVAIRELLLLVR